MSKLLGPTALADLLAPSIKDAPVIAAASTAVDSALAPLYAGLPRLLLRARLWQDASRLSPPLRRLTEHMGGLPPLSDAELELLAWQAHVDFWNPSWPRSVRENLVKYSTRWHRLKGTPAGMKAAFALFGMDISIEEDGEGDYWATYQLGLPEIADLESVKTVCEIAYEMHPQRCKLYRLYTAVWDTRPGSYDVGFYDVAAYDYYSGVEVPGLPDGGDLLVSFGRRTASQSEFRLTGMQAGRERLRGVLSLDDDDMSYDAARYDHTELPANHGFVRSRLNSVVIGTPRYRPHTWTGRWDSRQWLDIESVGLAREAFFFARRSIAAIEALHDDSVYDDLNSHYEQPEYALIDNPPRQDEDAYDEHEPGRRRLRVDEIVRREKSSAPAERLLPEDAGAFTLLPRIRLSSGQCAPFLTPVPVWNGQWNSRPWRAGGAYTLLTHEVTS